MGLRLEAELEGEVGALTEPVTGKREDGLQQDQTRLKVRSDGVFCHAGQSEAGKEPRVDFNIFANQREMLDFSPRESTARHSHVDVILDEVAHNKIVTELGKVHGRVLVFGQDVAVSPILQQEAHYISIPSFASLM